MNHHWKSTRHQFIIKNINIHHSNKCIPFSPCSIMVCCPFDQCTHKKRTQWCSFHCIWILREVFWTKLVFLAGKKRVNFGSLQNWTICTHFILAPCERSQSIAELPTCLSALAVCSECLHRTQKRQSLLMLLQHEFKLQQKSFTVVHLHMPFTLMVLLLLLQRFLSFKKKALSEKMQVGVQLIELLFT